jgi:hypothetical protein
MTQKPHFVNRGDGVLINLKIPLRYRDEQMGIKKKKGGKR